MTLWIHQKGNKQEKNPAGWSTPIDRVRPALKSSPLARATYKYFVDASLLFFLFLSILVES